MDAPRNPDRRRLFKVAGATGLAASVPLADARAAASGRPAPRYVFFRPAEAAFIEAAVARLIPKDELGPGALEADVPVYIDRQLAGAWGAGERLYRSGPWREGTPSQGYQLPFTPAELFRNALRAVDAGFPKLAPQRQDEYLNALHEQKRDLGGVPSDVFFESLLGMTIEGFFSDPAYGGNRDMAGWKLIGFPGAYSNYYDFVDQPNARFPGGPSSLAEDSAGHVHLIPVRQPARRAPAKR
jgi:gluconate 2-dehydrogenase gamma chain